MTANKFNLIDEKWIPIADRGLASLSDIFTDPSILSLGGDPVQKISILKLLLAIAQSAWTPATEDEWRSVGFPGMGERVLKYLSKWYEAFWLYGEKPFLQMPAIEKAEKGDQYKIGNATFPDLYQDNNTILTEYDILDVSNDDVNKALFLISVQSFAFAGKQVNPRIILCDTKDYKKSSVAKVGPSLGRACYLHSFVFLPTLTQTIFYNLFSNETLRNYSFYENGIGNPFWENMPDHEISVIGTYSKKTLIGTLVPLCRFILLKQNGLYFTEGFMYPKFQDGWIEPSFIWSMDETSHILTVKTDKKPWRNLTSILSFMGTSSSYNSLIVKNAMFRLSREKNTMIFSIWAGGLSVTGDAFGQKVKGADDFVESEIQLSSAIFNDQSKFIARLNSEMEYMDKLSSFLWGRVNNYFRDLKVDGKAVAGQATSMYWQLCERSFQSLVSACSENDSGEKARVFRNVFLSNAYNAYDRYCPNYTARQMEAWARNRLRYVENE